MSFFETTPAGRILNRFSRFDTPCLCRFGRSQCLSKCISCEDVLRPRVRIEFAVTASAVALCCCLLRYGADTNFDSDIYRVDEVLARTFNMVSTVCAPKIHRSAADCY